MAEHPTMISSAMVLTDVRVLSVRFWFLPQTASVPLEGSIFTYMARTGVY
jgi:hypothetical protein